MTSRYTRETPNKHIVKEQWENEYIFKDHTSLDNNRDMDVTEELLKKYLPDKQTSPKRSDPNTIFSRSKVYLDRYVESPPKSNAYKTSFTRNANHSYEMKNPPHMLHAQNASGSSRKTTDYSQPKLKPHDVYRFVSPVESNYIKPLPMSVGSTSTGSKQFGYQGKSNIHGVHSFKSPLESNNIKPFPMSFGGTSTGSKQFEYQGKSNIHDVHCFKSPPESHNIKPLPMSFGTMSTGSKQFEYQGKSNIHDEHIKAQNTSVGPTYSQPKIQSHDVHRFESNHIKPLPMSLNTMSIRSKQFEYKEKSNEYSPKHSNFDVLNPSTMFRRPMKPSLGVPEYAASQLLSRYFPEKPMYAQTSFARSYSCASGRCLERIQTDLLQQEAHDIANEILDRPVSVPKSTQHRKIDIKVHSSTCLTCSREDDCFKKSPTSSKTSLKNHLNEKYSSKNYEGVKQDCSSKSCLKDIRDDRKHNLSQTSTLSSTIYPNDSKEEISSRKHMRPVRKCVSYSLDDDKPDSSFIHPNGRQEDSCSKNESKEVTNDISVYRKCSSSKTRLNDSLEEKKSCCLGRGDSKSIRLKGNKSDVVLTVKHSLCSASEPIDPDSRNPSPYSKSNLGYCSKEEADSENQITQASYFDDIPSTYKTTSKHGAYSSCCSPSPCVKQRSIIGRFNDFMGNIITPFTYPEWQRKQSISPNVPNIHKSKTELLVSPNNRRTSIPELSGTNLSNLSNGNDIEYPLYLEDSYSIGNVAAPKQNAYLDRIITLARSPSKHSDVFKDSTIDEYQEETSSYNGIRHPLDGPIAKRRSMMTVEPPRQTAVHTYETWPQVQNTETHYHKDVRHPLDGPIPTKRSKVPSKLSTNTFPDSLLVNGSHQKHMSTSLQNSTSNRKRYQNDSEGFMSPLLANSKDQKRLKNKVVGAKNISGNDMEFDSNKLPGQISESDTEKADLVSKRERNIVEASPAEPEFSGNGNVLRGKIGFDIPLDTVFEQIHEEPIGLRSNQLLSYSNNSPTETEKCRVKEKSNLSELTTPNEKQDKRLNISSSENCSRLFVHSHNSKTPNGSARQHESPKSNYLFSLMIGVEDIWAVACFYMHIIRSLLVDTAEDFRRYKQCASTSKRLNFQPSPLCQPCTTTPDEFVEQEMLLQKRKLCKPNPAKRKFVTEIENSQGNHQKEINSLQQIDDIRLSKQVQQNEMYCVQLKRGGSGPEMPWDVSPSEFRKTHVKVTQRPPTWSSQQDDTSSERSWGSF